ncbi:MAG: TerB family tellurite resistance protein [Sedimentisphaerales bacterium]|nr:TerB family tellurite resistance protein [Sedimentisphaerales bacterium]
MDVSAIEIDICGSIHALTDKDEATLKITVFDVTGKCRDPKPVLAGTTQWRIKDSGVFCYTGELGRLTGRDTVLSDWTSVAKLQIDWLLLPRSGKRQLFFHISILSRRDSQEMASADYVMAFTNRRFGYLDMQENRLRTRKLAIEVAFAVSAADGKLFRCEVDVIKDWAREDMAYSHATDDDRRRIDKILKKTFGFFRKGRKFNMRRACEEIVNIASPARRHDIVELCLRVAAANGFAVRDELAILRDLADWLEIEPDVFRGIMEKALPVNMHEVKDAEVVLGVTRDMNEETARRHLNKEYSKWNARVTNSDPQIQAQADEMLGLIADTRREYIG